MDRQARVKYRVGKVTGGIGYIVDVKDARRADYLAEVTKYAVKGSQEAKWTGAEIVTFITAFQGVRAFGVFGSLYGERTKFAEFIASLKDAKPLCDCGSCSIAYYSESEWLLKDLHATTHHEPRPPSPSTNQIEMFHEHQREQQSIAAMAR